jgi:hypothetical protein
VDDPFQRGAFPFVIKDDSAEFFPVDLSVWLKDFIAELLLYLSPGRPPAAHDIPGDLVRIHDMRPKLPKES